MAKLRNLLLCLFALGMLTAASKANAIILPSCQSDCNCNRPCTTKCVDDDTSQVLFCDQFICSGRCVATVTSPQSEMQAAWNALFSKDAPAE
jgi:hypothetical protein